MKRLNVLGSYFAVRFTEDISEYGHYNYDRRTIAINSNHLLEVQQDTLGHELMHAIEDIHKLELGEEVVDKLGVSVVKVLRENPQLVEFLTRK
jgi:Zn-dependent peptidase ImmA (M78 family)